MLNFVKETIVLQGTTPSTTITMFSYVSWANTNLYIFPKQARFYV